MIRSKDPVVLAKTCLFMTLGFGLAFRSIQLIFDNYNSKVKPVSLITI